MLLKWRLLSREWQLPNPELSIRGRLKELWKPLLQITHGLTVYDNLAGFVEEQKNERLRSKQDTLEGHIVKTVTELYNEANETSSYVPFRTIWEALAEDLDGKIDDKKPHVMDTSEFFNVTKNKVGYRLREVVSGKSKTVREGDVTVKAYEFNQEKLRRIAKKYGYELVTKLPLLPTSEGVKAPVSTLTKQENNVEKGLDTPLQLGNVSNLITNAFLKTVKFVKALNPVTEGNCYLCNKNRVLYWQLQNPQDERADVCQDCGTKVQKMLQKEGDVFEEKP